MLKTMSRGKSLAIFTAALMLGAAVNYPAAAQNYGQSYGNDPYYGSQGQYDQQPQYNPYDNGQGQYDQQGQQYGQGLADQQQQYYNPYAGNPGQYDQQRQQYDQKLQQYDQQRQQYDQSQADQQQQYQDQLAQQRREQYDHAYSANQDAYYRDCQNQHATNQTGGLIIGAIAGGLLGSTVARGPSRGAGAVLGAIAGGAVGAGVGGSLGCEDRGYVNRTYYSGFEAGRNNANYRWRNDNTGNYGDLKVNDYYQDRDGFRCARFTQTIWIDGRPIPSSGHACRQRDGNWAIVD